MLQRLSINLLSQEPAAQLIRQTARQQWRLIALNLGSSLMEAFSEGGTLGLVFLAVEVLSVQQGAPFNWGTIPVLSWSPSSVAWLNELPSSVLFLVLLGLALILQAFQSFTKFLNGLSISYFTARCRTLVTSLVYTQVLSFSFPCASNYKIGDLNDYATVGPQAVRVYIEQISMMLVGLLLSVTYLVVLTAISPWLLVAVALIATLITLAQKQLLPRIRAGSKRVTNSQAAISSRITEDFQGLRLLHSTGQLDVADQRLRGRMSDLESHLRAQGRRMAVIGPFSSFLPILAIVLLSALSLLLLGGRSTGILPSLVTFVFALQKLNGRISIFSANLNQLAENSGRMQRLNALLSQEGKQFRRSGGIPFVNLKQAIRLENVSLRYSSDMQLALSDISFTLPKGKMLALVGQSGSGKSSIADLLTGLYTPTEGRILIDETPLCEFDLGSWQHRLGVVSQDTFLFNASIADNISFGMSCTSQTQIQSACRAAQADEFIQSMPQGYETLVGERGYRLSGGQRQRLSLARAILRDPELMILDEATSALDSQCEHLVQEAIEQFKRHHTVLVIAHRLSTIIRADQILVLESGRVIQRGTHSSLLKEGGLYAELWSKQTHQQVAPQTLPQP